MKELQLSDSLRLPLDVITQKLAFLGITGSGKTYAAGKLAELLLGVGAQVVILDPVGVWWGLRLAADGKGKGFDIPIFGGLKGDVPLEPTAGAIIADLIVDRGISAVIDVSQFITSEHHKFALAFATRLFQRRKASPAPMHLILEESQEFAPQNPTDKGEEPKMLRAFERLWKLGRNFGIGGSLLSQRPQEINVKLRNMSSTIFAFNMIGKHERDAVKDWLKSNMSGAEQLAETLPSLEIGNAHVFSPRFIKVNKVVRILGKYTYDASATPDFKSAKKEAARALTPIDLDEIKRAMAATIEKAKNDDPQLLRARITQLERELKAKPTADAATAEALRIVKQQHQEDTERWGREARKYIAENEELRRRLAELCTISTSTATRVAELADMTGYKPPEISIVHKQQQPALPQSAPRRAELPRPTIAPTKPRMIQTGGAEQRVLDSLGWWQSLAIEEPTRAMVAFVAGYTVNGHFNNITGKLRSDGLIVYPKGDCLSLTSEGYVRVHTTGTAPSIEALHDRVRQKLSGAQQRLFDPLAESPGEVLNNEELATRAGYTVNGHFNNLRGSLRTLQLIEYVPGGTKLCDWLVSL